MLPYFLFLFGALLLGYLTFKDKEHHNRFGLIMLFLLMTLFAGLRSSSVGTDSGNYAFGFEDQRYESKSLGGDGTLFVLSEPGFTILQRIVGKFSSHYNDLFLAIAGLCSLLFVAFINRYTSSPLASLFVYITLGYYTFVFNGARQGIAIGIYMFAIPAIINRNFINYLLIVVLASLFHSSAIVAIPLYFFFLRSYSSKNLVIIVTLGIVSGLLLPRILSLGAVINDKIAGYENGTSGGYLLSMFYVMLTVFFVYQRKLVSSDIYYRYDVYLNMMIVGSIIYVIVSVTGVYSELSRFAAYFQIASILLWAEIVTNRIVPISRVTLLLAIVGHVLYFAVFLSQFGNLVPYTINFEYLGL